MPIDQFLDIIETAERSVAVLNRTEPEPFQIMIEKLFRNQNVEVSEADTDEYDTNTVVLLEDGNVVASSQLKELEDSILLVNSDLFKTGTRSLEDTEVPDVIDGLAGTQFRLRGYPESNSEKLLLILISRYIEKRAFEEGGGTLRSSFQRLSRLEDEQGTRTVYERIADSDVAVHVYGRPDWRPSPDFPVVMHAGHNFDFRSSWFVIHTPPSGSDVSPAALLAIELEQGRWDGYWTYDEGVIDKLTAYITANM